MIPYGRQDITQADIDAVGAVLRSDFLTQGPAVPRFEDAVAGRVRAKFGIAVNSATSALHIACMAFELGPGDLLWTVPNTFVASANCARYCGADVDFADIDPDTWNISVAQLREKLNAAKKANRLPNVVVPVHFSGQPTDQEEIWELSREYGFKVLEDASHSIGGSRNGEPTGSCRWSDIAVFSFHPVKIITTGEGGMALTNDEHLAARMRMMRTHGITRDAQLLQLPDSTEHTRNSRGSPPGWYYEQQLLGYNYRMIDLEAALGLSQLARLDEYVARRNQLAQRYNAGLADLPLQLPTVRRENRSAFHLYVVRLKKNVSRKSHRQLFDELRANDVGVNLHYIPVHLQPYYRALGFQRGEFPESEAYAESAITLPLYPAMTDAQQNKVIDVLHQLLGD
ncbi:MAG TPA: UDP-4-amino-4,6-dideoxy-N-acetyl-beta-L-altrosamine transaminase [Gemmatimonadaceae bacterium]|nr:UDP-4-amino-4,6-dideoxy-N-acetyl-beta-L-altrosamine transaminase [Gemmatimonadaceae bacterium]